MTVNNISFRGDLNGYDIFRAVCAGFKDIPKVCKGDAIFDQITQLDSTSTVEGHGKSGKTIKGYQILIAIIVVMIINFGALYLYRRHHKQKVNQELQL